MSSGFFCRSFSWKVVFQCGQRKILFALATLVLIVSTNLPLFYSLVSGLLDQNSIAQFSNENVVDVRKGAFRLVSEQDTSSVGSFWTREQPICTFICQP